MTKGKKTRKEKKAEKAAEEAAAKIGDNNVVDIGEAKKEDKKKEEKPLSEVEQLKLDKEELQDKFLRSAAEMDNMRRRMERERTELLKYGMESFFKDFLPVLDSFEKAIAENCTEEECKTPFAEGISNIQKQLFNTVTKHGLKDVEAKGAEFDPNLHQAIQRVNSDTVKTEMVGDEYAKGYTLNGRLIRASMVSVLVPEETKDIEPKEKSEEGEQTPEEQ